MTGHPARVAARWAIAAAAFALGVAIARRADRSTVIELLEAVGVIDLDDQVARHPAGGYTRIHASEPL